LTEPTSDRPLLASRVRALGAMLLASLALACAAAAPPAASPASPAPGAGDPGMLESGTPENQALLEQLHQDIVRNSAEIEPILEDGDIAQLTIEGSKLSVERIDQARAGRVAMILEHDYPKDEVAPRWFRRSEGPGRVFVVMGEGSLLLNITDNGISLEPGSIAEE